MKFVTVIGARPQFIKAALLSKELRKKHNEIIIHTGQHYDKELSDVFFNELNIPSPEISLSVGSGSHGEQTSKMITLIEQILVQEKPDCTIVYGDTNSTLSGALAASKLKLKVAHVEAGLRSYNRKMPEEINRVLTDHVSDLLFCPSSTAVNNLAKEGITKDVYLVGDIMLDILLSTLKKTINSKSLYMNLGIDEGEYYLATIHRQENTDDPERLVNIINALMEINKPVVIPLHPRTKYALKKYQLDYVLNNNQKPNKLIITNPVGYLDMISLEKSAKIIITDSGGIQKEAYWLGVPCVTLREETEWIETVQSGWNVLTGTGTIKIINAINSFKTPISRPELYGNGRSVELIVNILSG